MEDIAQPSYFFDSGELQCSSEAVDIVCRRMIAAKGQSAISSNDFSVSAKWKFDIVDQNDQKL